MSEYFRTRVIKSRYKHRYKWLKYERVQAARVFKTLFKHVTDGHVTITRLKVFLRTKFNFLFSSLVEKLIFS